MTLDHLFLTLRAGKLRLAVAWIAVMLIGLAIAAFLFPPGYKATAEIVVNEKTVDRVSGMPLPAGTGPNRVATQADVAQSARVIARALRTMGLADDPGLREQWKQDTRAHGDFEDWLVERVKKGLQVRAARDANLISIAYTGDDPAVAARIVNAIVQAYIATALELRQASARQYHDYLGQQAERLRAQLEDAQRRLFEFQKAQKLTALDDRQDLEHARLDQLSSQVASLQVSASEAQERAAASAAGSSQDVLKDPAVAALSATLSAQEVRMKELGATLGPQHPTVLELESSLAELRARLAQAKKAAAGSVRASSAVARAQLAERSRALDAQDEKVLARRNLRHQALILQGEADSAQRAYEAVLARASQAGLESGDTQPDVSVVKVATPPSQSTSASFGVLAASAAVIALLFVLAATFWSEMRRMRLRSAADVEALLGQPVVARIGKGHRRHSGGASRLPSLLNPVSHLPEGR